MLSESLVPGTITIDGLPVEAQIGAETTATSLHVGLFPHRLFLELNVFNTAMLSRHPAELMRNGVLYQLRGPSVADMTRGPLGHPGDGEYDRWQIDDIEFSFRFYKESLEVHLRGISLGGEGGLNGSRQALAPRAFELSFQVPRGKTQDFLKMSDSAWGFFQKKLDTT